MQVRSTNLDAPTLVDHIGAELLDHLIVCKICSLVFAAQEDSIGEAGCVQGRRIVSQSQVKLQERRATLALGHLTEQTLDDYLFNRLTSDERKALEHHIDRCSPCAQEIRQRETLVTLIRTVLSERQAGTDTSSTATGVLHVQLSTRPLNRLKNKFKKDE